MRKSPESNNQEYPAFDVELSRNLGSVASGLKKNNGAPESPAKDKALSKSLDNPAFDGGWRWDEVRMELEEQIK